LNSNVSLAALNDLPLVTFDRALNPKLFGWWFARFAEAGFEAQIVMETKQIQTALNMGVRFKPFPQIMGLNDQYRRFNSFQFGHPVVNLPEGDGQCRSQTPITPFTKLCTYPMQPCQDAFGH
jgi:hypothetical protein